MDKVFKNVEFLEYQLSENILIFSRFEKTVNRFYCFLVQKAKDTMR